MRVKSLVKILTLKASPIIDSDNEENEEQMLDLPCNESLVTHTVYQRISLPGSMPLSCWVVEKLPEFNNPVDSEAIAQECDLDGR